MNKLTRAEASNMIRSFYRRGLIDHYIIGYCRYAEDGLSKWDLEALGSNSGLYGWNWTLYYSPTNKTMYCDSYRNAPVVEL